MKALAHLARLQSIRDRDDRHALMMRHVGPHDCDTLILGQSRTSKIERLKKAIAAARAQQR